MYIGTFPGKEKSIWWNLHHQIWLISFVHQGDFLGVYMEFGYVNFNSSSLPENSWSQGVCLYQHRGSPYSKNHFSQISLLSLQLPSLGNIFFISIFILKRSDLHWSSYSHICGLENTKCFLFLSSVSSKGIGNVTHGSL